MKEGKKVRDRKKERNKQREEQSKLNNKLTNCLFKEHKEKIKETKIM